MSTANVELDFFAMENSENASASASKSQSQNPFRRQRSLRDIQGAISKIKPEILKSVIGSGSVEHRLDNGNRICPKHPPLLPASPKGDDHSFQSGLPVYSPTSTTRMSSENSPDIAPLTIFYNETVAVFYVSRDEAENILKIAEKGSTIAKDEVEKGILVAAIPSNGEQMAEACPADGDLPIARKRSLQRFLEKRKERSPMV